MSQRGQEFGTGQYDHLGECEEFLAEIFERGSDVIYLFVNYKKAVMGFIVFVERDAWILFVVLVHILAQLPRYLTIVDVNGYSRPTLGKLD